MIMDYWQRLQMARYWLENVLPHAWLHNLGVSGGFKTQRSHRERYWELNVFPQAWMHSVSVRGGGLLTHWSQICLYCWEKVLPQAWMHRASVIGGLAAHLLHVSRNWRENVLLHAWMHCVSLSWVLSFARLRKTTATMPRSIDLFRAICYNKHKFVWNPTHIVR